MKLYSTSNASQSQLTTQPVNLQVASSTSRISPWLTPLAYFVGHNLVLPLFFGKINITGQENIPANSPIILAPTHRSRWDSILLPYATGRYVTGRDMRFMVTSSECQGIQGWFVIRMGGFPVDIQRPAIAVLRHAVELIAQGEMLVIYPEGGIYRDGKVHTLKPGISRLALTAESSHPGLKIKIIPISINYSQPYPNWGTDVNINIGKPIQVADYINGCLKRNAKSLTADLTYQLQQINHQESEITSSAFAKIHNS